MTNSSTRRERWEPVKKSRIAIVGCGLVGSSTAFSLVTQGVCDEIMMIDINQEKAQGEVMDLRDSVRYLERNMSVKVGSYAECTDVDIVVITAGPPPRKGQTRLDTLELSTKIVRSIVQPIMDSGFNGIFIVVSNPVDMIAHYVYRLSGLPKNQVIGTGTALDSARLQNFIGQLVNIDPRSVHAYTMGEHGDSQMCPWSTVSVAGKPFYDVLFDNKDLVGQVNLEDLLQKTAREGFEILERKGTTYYGIATTCVSIIKAIMYDENRIIPVSTLLDGEFGESDVFAGVPTVLNRTGASDILEIHMTAGELARFKESVATIRTYTKKMFEYDEQLSGGDKAE